ncbi:MAG: tetratricopeptide repeat protein [Isosphaeraceae bacterium]
MTAVESSLQLAGAWVHAGDLPRAEQACRRLVGVHPWVADAWFILGVVSQLQGRLVESVDHYRAALALSPGNAEVWNNLGASLSTLRRPEEAEPCLRQALHLEPDYAQAHNNLGNVLAAQGRLDDALVCYHQALAIDPYYYEVHDHIGLALQAQGRLTEAVAHFDQALLRMPEFAQGHMNRAVAWLQMGDFARGWKEYEWRWRCPEHRMRPAVQPLWDGGPLVGQTILLRAEQGLGDAIQFIRFAPLVKARGGRVVASCSRALTRLLATCDGLDAVVPEDDADPPFSCHLALMSLPRVLGSTLETIPGATPYMTADRTLVAKWRQELLRHEGVRVGIAWQGNPDHKKDRQRSFRLAQFEVLARLPGVRLFSLQKGFGTEQLGAAAGRFPIIELGSRLHDLMDAAAVIANLDLVIAPDTALAHLSGAIGVPIWVALPYAADWRWMPGRDDTPWYPTMRLFRQRRWGDWDEVFARIARELVSAKKCAKGA